jgi:uncharacterized protein (TIGR03067 family)
LRVIPKIDLSGFEHKLVEHSIRLRDGKLEEGGTAWDDERSRLDTRQAPTSAMIEEAIRNDRQQLQGTWKMTSGTVRGKSSEVKTTASWIVTDDKIVIEMGERWEGKFSLDPAKSPRRIDIVTISPDGKKTEEIRGVYELRDGDLYVCLAFGDEARPANLRSSSDSSAVSLILKREHP